MQRRWLVIMASMLAVQGCTAEEPAPHEAEADFSVFPEHASMLPEIERAGGEISVCISVIDAPEADVESWRARTRANIDDTVKKWNDLLRNNPAWSVPEVRTRYVYTTEGRCASTAAMVKVNVWTKVDVFKADHCATRTICVSSANPSERSFFLGPWNRTRVDDPLDPFLTLHEYGHLLGLGDTYAIPDMHTWIGEQPLSVMGGTSGTLTDDDRLGLWVTLRAVKTGVRSCEGFGQNVEMTRNKWNVVMCDSKGYFINTHGEVLFRVGSIPAEELNRAASVRLATALNCRSGPGTEFGVVAETSRDETYPTEEESPGVRFRMSAAGTPWVRLRVDSKTCYVAARYELLRMPD